jgi:hypothetical protein
MAEVKFDARIKINHTGVLDEWGDSLPPRVDYQSVTLHAARQQTTIRE